MEAKAALSAMQKKLKTGRASEACNVMLYREKQRDYEII
jgi:hypothetical protein